jgi:hypothetical protein
VGRVTTRLLGLLLLLGLGLACGSASAPPANNAPGTAAVAEPAASVTPDIELLATDATAAPGSDEVPRMRLAFRLADGSRRPIDGQALAYVPFRDGVALVDEHRQLVLVDPAGARRVLARESGAPPARGAKGELVYVARYDLGADLHVLDAAGRDRVLARGLVSAGLLAPQSDGRVLFVGAGNGGVAGVWLAAADVPVRCLTNCELTTGGQPGLPGFVPLPSTAEGLRIRGDAAVWQDADGNAQQASLQGSSASTPRVAGDQPGRRSGATQGGAP